MADIADRVDGIEPFRVVEILSRARELSRNGRDILHLEAGEPDFPTAEPIIRAVRLALQDGHCHYTEGAGIPALREALARYYATVRGIDVPAQRILITTGGSAALLLTVMLLVQPGDEVLITDPGYPCYRHFIRLAGGIPVSIPVGPEERYQLSESVVAHHWSKDTAGVLLASPANPTGAMLDREALDGIRRATAARKGWLISDEVYHGLSYESPSTSLLSLTDSAFVIGSFSKYFGMTGWRLGWLIAPEIAVDPLERLAQNLFISPPTIAQHAALEALTPETGKILDQRRDQFAERRNFLYRALCQLGFKVPLLPEGAMYIYADASAYTDDTQHFCTQLLEEHGIATVPGLDFGNYRAARHLRFAYTAAMEQLQAAVQRLERLAG